jgi:hypothetical protein
LISEEASLFAKYLRKERKEWRPRILSTFLTNRIATMMLKTKLTLPKNPIMQNTLEGFGGKTMREHIGLCVS